MRGLRLRENAKQSGLDFLIDIEKYSEGRFGSGDGIVDWAVPRLQLSEHPRSELAKPVYFASSRYSSS